MFCCKDYCNTSAMSVAVTMPARLYKVRPQLHLTMGYSFALGPVFEDIQLLLYGSILSWHPVRCMVENCLPT